MYKVGDLLKHAVRGETVRITAIGQIFYGIMRENGGSVYTFDKGYIHKYFLPVTSFKIGDVVSRKDNGRIYKIVSELTNNSFKIQSVTSGNYYEMTNLENYTVLEGTKYNTEALGCNHDWKVYNSGFTIDNYCAKCNAKRAYEGPL